jgi:hypothetical protein
MLVDRNLKTNNLTNKQTNREEKAQQTPNTF